MRFIQINNFIKSIGANIVFLPFCFLCPYYTSYNTPQCFFELSSLTIIFRSASNYLCNFFLLCFIVTFRALNHGALNQNDLSIIDI